LNQVSLRGASAKEQTRDELLDRVAQERAIRSLAKQGASSALVIQVLLKSQLHSKGCLFVLKRNWSPFRSAKVVVSELQRIWRGRSVARKAAAQARADWDEQFLSRNGENQSRVSADAISNQMLRPLFMILRHSRCFSLHQTQESAEDAGRLATCFKLLLQSIHNPGGRSLLLYVC